MSCERTPTPNPRNKSPTTGVALDLEANQGQETLRSEPMQIVTIEANENEESQKHYKRPRWYKKLVEAGVEENGIRPVPLEDRIQTQYNKLFTVFFSCLLCVLPYAVVLSTHRTGGGKHLARELEANKIAGCQLVHLVL